MYRIFTLVHIFILSTTIHGYHLTSLINILNLEKLDIAEKFSSIKRMEGVLKTLDG